jgi:hypothetical protein
MLTIDLVKTTGCSVSEQEAERGIPNQGSTPSQTPPCSPRLAPVDGASGGKPSFPDLDADKLACTDKAQDEISPTSDTARTEGCSARPGYTITVEHFSEDQIEAHLAGHLSAYRAFYLEPDEAEVPRPRCVHAARQGWRTLRAVFGDRLSSAADHDFLLQREEEDVLNRLLSWVREKQAACRPGPFEGLSECIKQLGELKVMAFVKTAE